MRSILYISLAFTVTGCTLRAVTTAPNNVSSSTRTAPRVPSASPSTGGDSTPTSPVKVINKDGTITTETSAENLAKSAAKTPSPNPKSKDCFRINPLTGRGEWVCDPNIVAATPTPTTAQTPAPVQLSPTPSPAGQVLRKETITGVAGGGLEMSIVREADGTVSAYAASTFAAPVTVKFNLQPQNLDCYKVEADGSLTPATEACATVKNGTRKVMSMKLSNPSLAWNVDYTDAWFFGNLSAKPDGTIYKLPFEKGTTQTITQGPKGPFSHQSGTPDEYAVDWGMAAGTNVRAARGGTVAAYHDGVIIHFTDPAKRNLLDANWLVIQHDDGTMGCYWHLQNAGIKVRVGQRVEAGDVIALSGDTGFTNGPHLHFGVYTPSGTDPYQSAPFEFQLTSTSRGSGPSIGFTAFE